MNVSEMLKEIRSKAQWTQAVLAQHLGASLVSVNRWERGASEPSPGQVKNIEKLLSSVRDGKGDRGGRATSGIRFMSRGLTRSAEDLPLFSSPIPKVTLQASCSKPLLEKQGFVSNSKTKAKVEAIVNHHRLAANTIEEPPTAGMSAGKNTYTYDAHTYHTKVPPQGIAELLRHYLPDGGLVLDPFAGSGMTGVAARALGYDCILNELSPAACFIADRFTSSIDPRFFSAGVDAVLEATNSIRRQLYFTECRECHRSTEIHYVVWSYKVICSHCENEFVLWDHCRRYGNTVKEHKILSTFACPNCSKMLNKSTLRRTTAVPVELGYKCCSSHLQHKCHPLQKADYEVIESAKSVVGLMQDFYPQNELPDGVNLNQPKRHGLTTVDKFYTPRNLAAMASLWEAIHKIENPELAAYLGFVFTSLYQRVTRLSEFRFWGGSGNTARFNVPFIFNEANVFHTFLRKARSIQDHLEATAITYGGRHVVINGSATNLSLIPDEAIDLVFTDPPFGANINYSDMNFLWESWLGKFTNTKTEAIINRAQGKGVGEYQELMTLALKEAFRVLRKGHWLLLVFMNSSHDVWNSLRLAIQDAGFLIEKIDTFDKQHGTFKQFVSDNTAGMDLVLHCRKPLTKEAFFNADLPEGVKFSVEEFLASYGGDLPTTTFLHVGRGEEIDCRTLYSKWMAGALVDSASLLSFPTFRTLVNDWLKNSNYAKLRQQKKNKCNEEAPYAASVYKRAIS